MDQQTEFQTEHLGILTPGMVDRLCEQETKTQELIKGFMPRGAVAIVGGDSAIGKTPFFYQQGLCVATGEPFLGMNTVQGRVIYLDLESPQLRDCQRMRDSLVRFLKLDRAPDDFLLGREPQALERILQHFKPQLLVIDSLRSFCPDVTEKNAAAGRWLMEVRKLAQEHGCSIQMVHHLRKPDRTGQSSLKDCSAAAWLLAMEGPRALVNQVDTRIAMEEGSGDPVALSVKVNRKTYGELPLMDVERVYEDGEPAGYRVLTGKARLPKERLADYDALPEQFGFAQASKVFGVTADPTHKRLTLFAHHGLLIKLPGRQGYRKLDADSHTGEQVQ